MSDLTPSIDPLARREPAKWWRAALDGANALAHSPPDRRRNRPMSRADLLKPADVCAQLKVSRAWLYRAAADGRIPSLRLGGPAGPGRFEPRGTPARIGGPP